MVFVPFISTAELGKLPDDELKTLEKRLEYELSHAKLRVTELDDALQKIRDELGGR
ncbi:MAG: hypothetical protein AAF409_14110 [Pseudomonadota bacterium]